MAKKINLKKVCPQFVINYYLSFKRNVDEKRRRRMKVKDIFAEIYDKNLWGKSKDKFNSGSGSIQKEVTDPYIEKIISHLNSLKSKPEIVDLGCGNFEVGKRFVKYCKSYTGVDIVPNLINELNEKEGSKKVRFVLADLIKDDLPKGEIAFVRQVFQHLSNEQISKIIPKLKKYKTVFITEHYPTDDKKIIPNKNIVPGSAIRLYKNSAVYLDRIPFKIPTKKLKLFLEVPGHDLGDGVDRGVIRTFRLDW